MTSRSPRTAAGLALLVALALAIALAACSDDEGSETTAASGSSEPSELALLVPENPFGVLEVDLAAAREALGLRADADPRIGKGSPAQGRFTQLGLEALVFYSDDRQPAVADAIDPRFIQAAAVNAFPGASAVILIRTTQPFEEIAGALEARGFKRNGDLLDHPGNVNKVGWPEVAAARGDTGLIAVSADRGLALEAVRADPADPDSRADLQLLGQLPPAPARLVETGGEASGPCVVAIGVADPVVSGGEGQIVIEVDGQADDASFALPAEDEALTDLEIGDPEVDGSRLSAPLTLTGLGATAVSAIPALRRDPVIEPYSCL